MTQIDMGLEIARRKSKTQRLLELFKAKGEITTRDLYTFGTGCSSRLKELRKEGHVIVSNYERPGFYRYTYLGEKDGTE